VTIIAAADGSALGNPGPAGWGWYVDEDRWAAGGWPHGTNNQGELTAVLDLLHQTAHVPDDLVIYCDSQYAINSITKWMAGWKKRGWRKADGKAVVNVDIMRALDASMTALAAQGRRVEFRWVKGHAGHVLNEQADRLANGAASAYALGEVPNGGPGIPGANRMTHELTVQARAPRPAPGSPPTGAKRGSPSAGGSVDADPHGGERRLSPRETSYPPADTLF
jgi:ribonuclease HI